MPRGGFSAHLLLEVIIFPRQACAAVSETPAGNAPEPSFLCSHCLGHDGAREGIPSQPRTLIKELPMAAVSKFPSADSSLEAHKS